MATIRNLPTRQPILEAIPPVLLLSRYPMDEADREAWFDAREAWCIDHGYDLIDLLRAEVRQKRR